MRSSTYMALENGLEIIDYTMPYFCTACIKLFVHGGSRAEHTNQLGYSHYLEHISLKTSDLQKYHSILVDIDSIGGGFTAYTGREYTCFGGIIAKNHIKRFIDILYFIYCNFDINDDIIQRETPIIMDEINGSADEYNQSTFEKLMMHTYPSSGLGNPILGTSSTLQNISVQSLSKFRRRFYVPNNTTIVITGGYDKSDIQYIKSVFGVLRKSNYTFVSSPALFMPNISCHSSPTQQNYMFAVFSVIPTDARSLYNLRLVGSILGSGYSSKLNYYLREQLGLCYSVYSFILNYTDARLLGISITYNPTNEEILMSNTTQVLKRIKNELTDAEELTKSVNQYHANTTIEYDNLSAMADKLFINRVNNGVETEIDQITNCCEHSAIDLREIAYNVLNSCNMSLCVSGSVREREYYIDKFVI